MKAILFNIILFVGLLFSATTCYSQDAVYSVNSPFSNLQRDKKLERDKKTIPSGNRYLINFHFPMKEDYQLYDSSAYLINVTPSIKNYQQYFKLALALWRLNKMEDAEKMLLTIADSGKPGTDIFDDNTVNNFPEKRTYYPFFKNHACTYLAKIYVEKNEFTKALVYLDKAINKYPITYKCGSQEFQKEEYLALNSHCYKMLNKKKEYLDCVLPEFITWRDNFLISAIKEIYTPQQIADYLIQAKNSITCIIDTFPYVYHSAVDDGKRGTKWDTITYHPSSGTIDLFDRKIILRNDFKSPENKEAVKNYYLNLFEGSEFYRKLFQDDRIVKAD